MPRNADSLAESPRGCQVPVSPLVAEVIRLGGVVRSVSAISPGLVRCAISGRNYVQNGDISDADFLEDLRRFQDKKLELLRRPGPKLKGEFYGRVRLMKCDVEVKRRFSGRSRCGSSKRGKITCLSLKARHRLLVQARNVDGIVTEVTLTWPSRFPTDGLVVKRNLWAMLHWLSRRGIGGMWFLEFQKRGAPHFHLFVSGKVGKAELSRSWYRIVKSGDVKHLKAGTEVSAIRKPYALAVYAAKYAAKWSQKVVPEGYRDVGRFWGLFGGVKVEEEVIASGKLVDVAKVIRLVRRAYVASRRSYREWQVRKFRDGGCRGFTAWGVAPGIRRRLDEVLTLCYGSSEVRKL